MTIQRIRSHATLAARLMAGAAAVALSAACASNALAASAPEAEVEELIVTGTNIRGVAPVGQNIVQLGRDVIEQTSAVSVQELLATAAPQLNGFGSAGQTAGSFEPRLRSLGGSSSASTLILVDGHRITPGGGVAFTSDPNVIPAGAIERVEILPDGASSLYGSDAVAGVINIITRRNYNGWELNGQLGFADGYSTRQGNVVYGHAWDDGSVLATYGYTYRSDLEEADRSFVSGNQSNTGPGATGRGGNNFNNYACAPATFIPAAGQPGAGRVFASPYTGAGIQNQSTLTGLCSTVGVGDLLPSEEAHRVFVSIRQNVGERVKLAASFNYSHRESVNSVSRGAISNVTVFGPGSTPAGGAGQINPFFRAPAGVNRGTISFDFNEMFGPGAETVSIQESFLGNASLDVDLGREWLGSFQVTVGLPKTNSVTMGTVCQSCAYLSLNGSSVTSGNTTTNATPTSTGLTTVVTQLPLTTANALDVWSATGGSTSAAIRDFLLNNRTFSANKRPITDLLLKFDGPLFTLPGGPVRAAFGGELYYGGQSANSTNTSAIGPTTAAARSSNTVTPTRTVKSAFAEIIVPIVGEEMGVPLVKGIRLDVSGRIDHYSDIVKGANVTKNPRFGLDWEVNDDLLFRASYGTSFTAPMLGHNELFNPGSTISDYFGTGGAAFVLPEGYPNRAFLGCPATGNCTVTNGSGRSGITTFGGNADLEPQTGRSWSVGFDFRPRNYFEGFHASATVWGAVYRNVITNIANITQRVATPGLEDLFVINPTQAQIAAATFGRSATSPLPARIDFLNITTQDNMFHMRGKGVDFDVGYDFDTGVGRFSVGAVGEIKYDWWKQTGTGVILRATNIANTTNTFSPVAFAGRGSVAWRSGPWRTSLFANYTSAHYLTDNTLPFQTRACPDQVTTNNLGCQRVASNLTFDTNISYTFGEAGLLRDLQVSLDVRNLLDKDPPFVNSTDGYGNTGNPIGRLVSVSLRKRW